MRNHTSNHDMFVCISMCACVCVFEVIVNWRKPFYPESITAALFPISGPQLNSAAAVFCVQEADG